MKRISTRAALRLFYAAMFASFGAYLPYFPRWLEARGVTGFRMSAVAALLPAMGVAGPPAFGLLADTFGLRASLLRVACLGAALPILALAAAGASDEPIGFAALVAVVAAYAFFRSPMTMMADVLAIERTREHGDVYGRTRLWGSIGFLLAALAIGAWVDYAAPALLPLAIGGALAVAFGASCLLPARAAAPPGPVWGRTRALLASRAFLVFLTIAFLSQVAHASYDLCATLHLRVAGASGAFIGAFWAFGVACEVVLMSLSGPLVARAGARRLLALGLFGATLRWTGMALFTSPSMLLALQPLHACSFALVWLACLGYLKDEVDPAIASTGQGLFSAAVGAGSVVGMLAWGPLYAERGGAAVFGCAAIVALLALAVAVSFVLSKSPKPSLGDSS